LAVKDELTQSTAAALFGQVEESGAKRAKRKRPENLAAYDHLLRGIDHQQRGTKPELVLARQSLLKAIEADPELAIAYAFLALVDQSEWDFQGDDAFLHAAVAHAEKAVELDEDDARCNVILGYIYLWATR